MTSKVKVNTVETESGSTLTLGKSGDTVTLASGASQSGFGRNGSVNWQTSIKTSAFTAVSGEGYFCNTSSAAFTVTLPASPSVGDIVAIKDYGSSFSTNNLTIARNGSNLNGAATDSVRSSDNESLTMVYADATQGWLSVEEGTGFIGESFVAATGGTITTCGNCKIHTFTGPGCFTVSSIASAPANNIVSYMVVAGGGGSGGSPSGSSGGGGAGGFRELKSPSTPYTASPLDGYPSVPNRITAEITTYPITVGAGGSGGSNTSAGSNGSNSVFSTITAAGGGGSPNVYGDGGDGGSGSGGANGPAASPTNLGIGNTPPTTPAQGNPGGYGLALVSPGNVPTYKYTGGGGGGATASGANGNPASSSGAGGAGATTCISGSPTAYAGGGGGGSGSEPATSRPPAGLGGTGGGGNGSQGGAGNAGTANTGGGAGGAGYHPGNYAGAAGGSGIVIIRYKFQ